MDADATDSFPESLSRGVDFKASGFAFLSVNATADSPQGGFDLGLVQSDLMWTTGPWQLQLSPRLMLTPGSGTTPYAPSAFIQQASLAWSNPQGLTLEVGRIPQRFGRNADYGFYNSVLRDFNIKMQPDLGGEVRQTLHLGANVELTGVAQYFVADGRAIKRDPGSLTVSWAPERRHHIGSDVVLGYHPATKRYINVQLSAQSFVTVQAPLLEHRVSRLALGTDGRLGPVLAFVEVGTQNGQVRTNDQLIPGHTYVWTGTAVHVGPVQLRYHFSAMRAHSGEHRLSYLHQPGAELTVNDSFSVMTELVLQARGQGATGRTERAPHQLFVVLNGRF